MRRMLANAAELDKFVFISGNFNFQNEERYENASATYPYNTIVSVIKKSKAKGQHQPIILYDTTGRDIFIGSVDENGVICYYLSEITTPAEFRLDYREEEDAIDCYITLDGMLTEDNVKTIFGQNITGTGDIALYRHFLKLSISTGKFVYLTAYSISDLKADSLQDLTTIIKPAQNEIFEGLLDYNAEQHAVSIIYENSIWKLKDGSSTGDPITKVEDVVAPLT